MYTAELQQDNIEEERAERGGVLPERDLDGSSASPVTIKVLPQNQDQGAPAIPSLDGAEGKAGLGWWLHYDEVVRQQVTSGLTS